MADLEKKKSDVKLDEEDADVEDVDDDAEMHAEGEMNSKLLKDPRVLAVLQGKLNGITDDPAEYVKSLPQVVKRRVKSLKKIQLDALNLEAKFYEEVHRLECKYHKLYQPMYDKRLQILNGCYEPTDEECEWHSASEDDEELSKDLESKAKIEGGSPQKEAARLHNMTEDTKGIPEFWLTIFKNVDLLSEMTTEQDYPILQHLQDIKVVYSESPMSFLLEFHFSANDYFTNSVLTKHYDMKCAPDEDDPFAFEGPEIYRCKGCTIDWKKGKNVTVKTVKKKQKHRSNNQVRTVTKTVTADSFFNFFKPPSVPDDADAEIDEELQALLTSDFEIGHFVRERLVPRAVLYFTGQALDDDADYEEEQEDEDDEELEEESEEEESRPKVKGIRRLGRG